LQRGPKATVLSELRSPAWTIRHPLDIVMRGMKALATKGPAEEIPMPEKDLTDHTAGPRSARSLALSAVAASGAAPTAQPQTAPKTFVFVHGHLARRLVLAPRRDRAGEQRAQGLSQSFDPGWRPLASSDQGTSI